MPLNNRAEFFNRFDNHTQAVEFENQALSISDEFLTPIALRVKAKQPLTVAQQHEYWEWLIEQVDGSADDAPEV